MLIGSSKTWLCVLLLASALGVGLSLYSLLHHYAFTSGSFCTINSTFDCDVVNRGPFSELFGIPVSFLGVMGYGFMHLIGWALYRQPKDRLLHLLLVATVVPALLFSFYLTGIEAFVLHAWCLLCITSQISMLFIAFAMARWSLPTLRSSV